jgi:hypothetical protein
MAVAPTVAATCCPAVATGLNSGRTQALNNWQETEKKFADDHMPHYH